MRAVTRLATPTIPNMPPRFHTVAICGVVAAFACGKTDRTPLESLPDARTNLQFVVDTAYLFPGTRRSLSAALTDSHGRPLMASKAVITTSDSTVAVIDSVTRETRRSLNGGISYDGWAAVVRFIKPGAAELRVTMGGLVHVVPITVRPAPLVSTAITVDSFTVFEIPGCAEGCSTFFEPTLRVSVSDDGPTVEVLAIELELTTRGTGLCVGSRTLAPGQSDDLLYYIDVYEGLWDSPFVMARAPGDSVVEEVATVRLLVRESSSDVRELRSTGRIRKVTEWPEIPMTNDYSLMGWSCG